MRVIISIKKKLNFNFYNLGTQISSYWTTISTANMQPSLCNFGKRNNSKCTRYCVITWSWKTKFTKNKRKYCCTEKSTLSFDTFTIDANIGFNQSKVNKQHWYETKYFINFLDYTISSSFIAVQIINGRQSAGPILRKQAISTNFYSKLVLLRRTLGHLSAVYCVLFDRTGKYILTVITLKSQF